MELLHPDALIRRLRRERYRCFIVTGRPGQGKTRFAKALAARTGGSYVDLLSVFAADPQLAAQLDRLTPQRFKSFLEDYHGDPVLIDEMEFLWHRWDDAEKEAFLTILGRMPKSAFFGVFLPPGPVLNNVRMADQDGRSRIFSLSELQSLE